MRIRHPILVRILGFVAAWIVRMWMRTIDSRYRPVGESVDPHEPNLRGRYIYAVWHEALLFPAYRYARPDMCALISQHADGQFITEVCRHLRFRVIRGSTTRGGVEAVRKLVRQARKTHLVITPDGPRGPRRQVQLGLIYLAARTGLPIVPVGVGLDRPWRARSWDRFILPRPWSRGVCVSAAPIRVPAEATSEEREAYRIQVEQAMLWATQVAERLAQSEVQGEQVRLHSFAKRSFEARHLQADLANEPIPRNAAG